MGARFASASSQYLWTSYTPTSQNQWTFAAWIYLDNAADGGWFMSAANSASSHGFHVGINGTTNTAACQFQGASTQAATTATGLTLRAWNFVIARQSADNARSVQVLKPDGTTVSASNNGGTTATGINNVAIGGRRISAPTYFTGSIAEAWWTNFSLNGNGETQLTDATLRWLAMHGPFGMPSLFNGYTPANLQDYISLKTSIPNTREIGGISERHHLLKSRRFTWERVGTPVALTHHPKFHQHYNGNFETVLNRNIMV